MHPVELIPSAGPHVYALLGDPVEHSKSARIQNAAFAACGLDLTYRAIRVTPQQLGPQLRVLAQAGGGGNVTVPHKQLAVAWIDHPSDAVCRTGAVNTFWRGPHGVHGDNTDVAGFRAAAAHHGVPLEHRRVLLLGAGGAAAAVLLALLQADARVTIVNRSAERARALAGRFAPSLPVQCATEPPLEPFDVVINATSLGMRPHDPLPLAVERLPERAAILDLVYASGVTRWVRGARAAGFVAFDGAEMLLRQAAAAFTLWTDLPAPLEVMRAAALQPGP